MSGKVVRFAKWLLVVALVLPMLVGCATPSGPSGSQGDLTVVPVQSTVAPAEPTAVPVQPAAAKITLRIGRIPQAQGMSPTTEIMRKQALVEAAGKELGVDITVDWQDFPNGAVIRQGLTSDKLDIGSVGTTPVVIGMGQGEPIHVLSVSEGRVKFLLALPPNSAVKTLDDLKNQKIGLMMGTEMQFFFDQLLNLTYGTSDYAAQGIEAVALKTQAQNAVPPEGLAATTVTIAPYLSGNAQNLNTALFNSFGYTEANYDGPLGKGAGIELPERKNSPYYPEGIWLARNYWTVNDTFLKTNPKAVTAFLVAQQRAFDIANGMDATEVAKLSIEPGYWTMPAEVGREVWLEDLNHVRGWVWATEGDLFAIVSLSELIAKSGTIEKPVTWQQVMENVEPVAALAEEAWKVVNRPAADAFTATDVQDLRGYPIWEMDKWERPKAAK